MVTRLNFSTFQPSVGSFGLNLVSRFSIASGSEGSDDSHTLALGRDGMSAASQTANLVPG